MPPNTESTALAAEAFERSAPAATASTKSDLFILNTPRVNLLINTPL
jgi:hypothetical protein